MKRGGANLKDELRRARDLGCEIWTGKGSEIKIRHFRMPRIAGCDSHRKDSSRFLTKWLNQLEALLEEARA